MPDPPGGTIVRDPAGAPTGLLLETAQDLVWRVTPPLSGPDIRHALSQIGRQILGYGITRSACGTPPPGGCSWASMPWGTGASRSPWMLLSGREGRRGPSKPRARGR